ncbi:16S rRNA (cytidine(1402)-2'-O)-methyltransferase [Candidatus Woesearchaeota archaeon CG10_big_fil_rev_8_21_14_0_10_44_13]|nr:MAG: 16S rRNA (cytidine(1402)-2'-O)-methyltransferase [Candidatus Woesearchaeota archaeon CG10_big_fil_rev_8_21_14_0_10_44_13]
MLYIISTPIGNLGDISQRAIDSLRAADLIVAEDTRRTINLLKHLGIGKKRMTSFDRHSERRKTPYILAELKEGKNIALVSDSGTPGINDPGEYLVKEAVAAGIAVSPVPGPSAIISALVCSGLLTGKFTFYGFAPKKEGEKRRFLEEMNGRKETKIFYESPYRIEKTIKLIAELIPESRICIARELTKMHEEFIRGTAKEVFARIKDKNLKGEMVIVLE